MNKHQANLLFSMLPVMWFPIYPQILTVSSGILTSHLSSLIVLAPLQLMAAALVSIAGEIQTGPIWECYFTVPYKCSGIKGTSGVYQGTLCLYPRK